MLFLNFAQSTWVPKCAKNTFLCNMAGGKTKLLKTDKKQSFLGDVYRKYCRKEFVIELFTDPRHTSIIGWLLIAVELILNCAVVEKVNYTEIDWRAYMQECEGFLNGTLDYSQLKGDTGPLVYPAGFIYIYSAFYYITSHGQNIRLAQYIFIAIYLLQLCLTFRIYSKTKKVPPYAIILVTLTSYRIHSIYVLRLFNDPIAVLLVYASLNAFLSAKWWLGSTLYSLAVSVKMNALLYAPGLLVAYLTSLGMKATALHILWCGVIQLVLGAPFLITHPVSYIMASFDLGRIFEHKWTVNYRFLPIELFENRLLHIALLFIHITLLLVFLAPIKRYLSSYAKLKLVETQLKPQLDSPAGVVSGKKRKNKPKPEQPKEEELTREQQQFLDSFEGALRQRSGPPQKIPEPQVDYRVNFDTTSQLFILPFFVVNLIGITCARSLHYQFYSWYFHSLLYLVYCTGYKKPIMFLILAIVEFCWNCYPSTEFSSAALHICHIFMLIGIYKTMKQ